MSTVVDQMYYETRKNHILLLIILFGAINYGTSTFGYNLVELFSNKINNYLGYNLGVNRYIYILIAISAIIIMFNRDLWLPFLGRNVMPTTLIPLKINPGANKSIEIQVTPNTRVAYWASKPTNDLTSFDIAYDDFSNSGVVISDDKGIAKLNIIEGSAYSVPGGKIIPKHVHYRELDPLSGTIGPIQSVYY